MTLVKRVLLITAVMIITLAPFVILSNRIEILDCEIQCLRQELQEIRGN